MPLSSDDLFLSGARGVDEDCQCGCVVRAHLQVTPPSHGFPDQTLRRVNQCHRLIVCLCLEPSLLHLSFDVLDTPDGVLGSQHVPQTVTRQDQHLVSMGVYLNNMNIRLRGYIVVVFSIVVTPKIP